MGKQDVISKSLFQRLVRDFAIYLLDLPVAEVELLDTEKQRVEDRRADLVARVKDPAGQVFVLHIEIQNHNDPLMPQRMLRYFANLALAHPRLPIKQYLVYIGKERLTMADGMDAPQLAYRYPVIDMHRVDCQTLLAQDSPDAWVLAVLADFKGSPARAIVHEILSRLLRRLNGEPPRLREYVGMLEVLASNRNLNLSIQEEFDMLIVDVENLPSYQMGMKKGVEKGIEKGRREAMRDQALAIAGRLLAKGMAPAEVAVLVKLPVAEVAALNIPPEA